MVGQLMDQRDREVSLLLIEALLVDEHAAERVRVRPLHEPAASQRTDHRDPAGERVVRRGPALGESRERPIDERHLRRRRSSVLAVRLEVADHRDPVVTQRGRDVREQQPGGVVRGG